MAQDWWRGAVVYQIYPRSFQDHSGDGIGDLKGIIQRLGHVASLGVDAIWLSPFFPSPMEDMGYDVSDYQNVDPMFGTLADFDDLVARAHELGLKVIIDQVISHSSDRHAWFQESRQSRVGPFADWYVWADPKPDGSPPNNWVSVFGGSAWQWEPMRRQFYLHNFLASQPDLNFHCAAVQDAMLETMRFWLERGVDGFRLDTVNYYFHDQRLRDNPAAEREDPLPPVNPYDMQEHVHSKNRPENLGFLERIRALTDAYDARTLVGEVGDSQRAIEIMGAYTAGGTRLHMAYSFDMLSPFFAPDYFRQKISQFFEGAPDGWPSWSFSNHDVNRHVSRWEKYGESPEALAKLSIALLAGFEGTIGIYQGEELGQLETDLHYEELTDPVGLRFWPENKGRDGCRTPMAWDAAAPNAGFSDGTPWLPVKPPQAARNVAAQEDDPDSVLNHYRAVLAFRRSRAELLAGRTRFLDAGEPVLAFHRGLEKTALTCVYNLSPGEVTLTAPGAAALAGPCQRARLDGETLALGPNGYAFLQPADPGAAIAVAVAEKSAETEVNPGAVKAGTISG
jgi:alpha-glucosidase